MRDNLLFYSFGEDEIVEAYENGKFSSLEQAAKYAYKNRLPHRDPKQDGLPSEILLDLLIQIFLSLARRQGFIRVIVFRPETDVRSGLRRG